VKYCPNCTSGYSDSTETCPIHGGKLSQSVELKPGMLFQNTYRIIRKLGEGSLGSVYLADHAFLDESRALRFLPRQLSRDEVLAARFRRELAALRQVRHQNVVNSGDLQHTHDDTPFVALEYVDGPDLQVLLDMAPGPFDVDLALAITRSIAEGLVAAHGCGLVHRNIKPKNILIAREGNSWVPKISGFALVVIKVNDASVRSPGHTVLNPTCAAPEQWYGTDPSELDGRTDLYALGGILYEMLTGQTSFHAADYEGWAMQHLHAQPPPPNALRPDLAEWRGLDDLTLSLLAKDREARPRSAADLLLFLDAVQFGIPIPQSAPANVIEEKAQPTESPEATLSEPSLPEISEDESSLATTPPSPVIANTTGPAEEEPAPIAASPGTAVAPDTSTPTSEEPVSVQAPSAIFDNLETTRAAEEEIAPAATRPAIPAPVDTVKINEEATSAIVDQPGILAHQLTPWTPLVEPVSPVPTSAASAPANLSNTLEGPVEKPDDFNVWLSNYASRKSSQEPRTLIKPEITEETLDIIKGSVETSKEPAKSQSVFGGTEDLGQETESSLEPDIPLPIAEPPRAMTHAEKELAELQRMFSSAETARSTEDKSGGTARLGRLFTGADAARDSEATSKKSAETEIVPASSSTVKESVAEKRRNTGEIQTLMTPANPAREPDHHAEADATEKPSPEKFSHPAWKILAALVVLAVIGLAGWRLSYTDPKLPPKNLSQGCNAGDAKVCSQLAAWYEQTNAVKDGDVIAATYYAKACDASFPLACRKLGFKYLFGKGIPQDNSRAMTLLTKACTQGDYQSCDTLAEIYHNGNGVDKDDAQAIQLYNKSCAMGEDFGCKWAARLQALVAPAPPVRRPRPATIPGTTTNPATTSGAPPAKPSASHPATPPAAPQATTPAPPPATTR
jgi:serine/threonine protein kinase